MIQYLTQSKINRQKWDDCLDRSYNSLVYGYSWYLDVVCDHWDALVLNDYEAVMPLPWREKHTIKYLYQPFFTQQLGIFSTFFISGFTVDKFIWALPSRFWYVDIQLNSACNPEDEPDLDFTQRANYLLKLMPSYEAVSKEYNDNTKRNITKALKNQFVVEPATSISNLIEFYRAENEKKTEGVTATDYKRLELLMEVCRKKGHLHLLQATKNGRAVSSAAFIECNQRCVYLLGVTSAEGKDTGSMHLLMDTFIRQQAGHSNLLDFEGSEIEGVARFFRGFGAFEQPYYHYRSNRLPFYIRWLKKS